MALSNDPDAFVEDSFPTSEKSRLIDAAAHNDVEELKLHRNSPKLYKTRDSQGYNLLQIAILHNSKEAFDFLLALDDYPLDGVNKQETALALALAVDDEYYAVELLLNKSTNLYVNSSERDLFLRTSIVRNFTRVIQCLIQGGANVNKQDHWGCTPLHRCLRTNNTDIINEGVSILLYYGADPSVRRTSGKNAFEDALDLYHVQNISLTQETLFLHVVDEHYEPSFEFLCDLIENKSPFFHKIVDAIRPGVVKVDVSHSHANYYINLLFSMELEFLLVLIEKFDYAVKQILQSCSVMLEKYRFNASSIENFELLLKSDLVLDAIEFIGNISIRCLIAQLNLHRIPSADVITLINYLLTYGICVYDEDLETVYETFGYCELFKTLLHMDIKTKECRRDIMAALIYDVTIDIDEFLQGPQKYIFSPTTLRQLKRHFAHPKLINFYYPKEWQSVEAQVPLLVELARNVARKYLVARFRATSSRQFYSILKWLPIDVDCKKLISFETKLYY